jgi:hypothetical protein
MTTTTDLQKLADLATLDVERLEKELDITNADHIALWLASSGQMSISYLAVQIANAYDRANAARLLELEAENKRLREGLEFIAEEIDAGRHDGLPEPSPAHCDVAMWAVARTALKGGEI